MTSINNRWLFILVLPLMLSFAGCSTPPQQRHRQAALEAAPDLTVDNTRIASRLSPEQARDITMHAVGLVGTPYRYGGNTPDSGFDCSGLIAYVYQSTAGLTSPRTVSKLQSWGVPVAAEQLRSGDLVLFAQRSEVTHAGIYVGEGRFVHAPSTGGEVRLDRLNSKYWASQQMAFRRP